MLCKNPTTKEVLIAVEREIIENPSHWHSKSVVAEIKEITEHQDYTISGLCLASKDLLTKMNLSLKLEKNRQSTQELSALLFDPSIENWYRIKQLLIPSALAECQDRYWGDTMQIEETQESIARGVSLIDPG